MDYHERKAIRREHYLRCVFGWKLVTCPACAGSGYYDAAGSPKCGYCEGAGRIRQKPITGGNNNEKP